MRRLLKQTEQKTFQIFYDVNMKNLSFFTIFHVCNYYSQISVQRNFIILNTINEPHYFIILRFHCTQKKSYCPFFHHHEAVIFPRLNWSEKCAL